MRVFKSADSKGLRDSSEYQNKNASRDAGATGLLTQYYPKDTIRERTHYVKRGSSKILEEASGLLEGPIWEKGKNQKRMAGEQSAVDRNFWAVLEFN